MEPSNFHKKAVIFGIGAAILLTIEPMQASASNMNLAKNVLETVGVVSLVEETLSEEEYIAIAEQAKGAHWGYTHLGIANVDSGNLNIRAIPSTDGKLVGKLPKHAACEIISSDNEWAHIVSGEVEGYVKLEFLLTGPDAKMMADDLISTVAKVTVDALKVRDNPSLDSAVYTTIPMGEELEIGRAHV